MHIRVISFIALSWRLLQFTERQPIGELGAVLTTIRRILASCFLTKYWGDSPIQRSRVKPEHLHAGTAARLWLPILGILSKSERSCL
jgi:hypothetical protein